eukprot:7316415-Prymnesium_polylepis.1
MNHPYPYAPHWLIGALRTLAVIAPHFAYDRLARHARDAWGVSRRAGRTRKSPDGIRIAIYRARGSVLAIWRLSCSRETSERRVVDSHKSFREK